MGKLGAWVGGDCLLIVSDVCADWGEVNVLNEVRGVFGLRVHTATFYVLEERFFFWGGGSPGHTATHSFIHTLISLIWKNECIYGWVYMYVIMI